MVAFVSAFLAISVLPAFAPVQDQGLRPPILKDEEIRRFHTPPVTGMSARERIEGYEHRLRLEERSPFANLAWRNVGPTYQGGRVVDIHVPRNKPNAMYVAYATGGLWRSKDHGITWTPLMDNESSFAIGDFDITDDGNTIWVGMGENNSQRTSYAGSGVFKSTDAGKTWQNMGLWETHRIGRVLIHPRNHNVVYVAAIGALYSQGPDRGVYKTTDGGRTWQHILKIDDYTGVIDLSMDPRNPDVLYAAAWDRDRRAWNFRESGKGSGFYKSTNGGRTWEKLTNGLPYGEKMGRTGIAVSPSRPDTIYALVDMHYPDHDSAFADEVAPSGELTIRRFLMLNDEQFLKLDKGVATRFLQRVATRDMRPDDIWQRMQDRKMTLAKLKAEMELKNPHVFEYGFVDSVVYRSDDAGKSWRPVEGHRLGGQLGYYCGRIMVNPQDHNDVVMMGFILLRTRDGGKTWQHIARNVHVDHHAFWWDPRDPKRMANGNDGGLYLSYDDGENWRHIDNMPVGQFTTIAVDNKRPYNIYGGLQDNGTMKGPSNSNPRQSPRQSGWTTIGGGDGSAIAVDPRDDGDIVYVAWQFGNHSAINQRTGERWNIRPPDKFGEPPLRFNWVSPIQISPHHPDVLYIGSQKLHRSMDKGRTWEDLSGDLSKNLPHGDVPFSTMKDLCESPFQFGLIYVGFDDGTVKVTHDHGTTWQEITTPRPDNWVSRVVASKWDKATVYVAQTGYRSDDFAPYLWKSTDYGKTWRSIAGNLPPEPINVIREDPHHSHILYVGTDLGVFVTFDGGQNWEPLHGSIPRTPVHDLAIQERDQELVAGTHARSVFVLDLKPLYQVTQELRQKAVHIWPVGNTRRDPRWGYQRRSAWDTRPPDAPLLRGQFWVKEPGKATVRVKDKDGKTILEKEMEVARGFNWFELGLELEPGNAGLVDPKAWRPTTVDDILKDPHEAERPKYIAVGEYTIEIEASGHKATTPWRVTG
jgi:photosystem II stability/assembly factor-like uncharacterized protein